MRLWQTKNAVVKSLVAVVELPVMLKSSECFGVNVTACEIRGPQRLHFRAESKQLVLLINVVNRFLAEAIAREEKSSIRRIPEGKRKHAVQSFATRFTPLTVRSEYYFGVCTRVKLLSEAPELVAKLDVVV